MNIEALYQLKRVLQEVKEKNYKFNMNIWYDFPLNEESTPDLYYDIHCNYPDELSIEQQNYILQHKCNTVACAAGWAAQDSWFIERGLRVSYDPDRDFITGYIEYLNDTNIEALMYFFNTSRENINYLFDPQEYNIDIMSITVNHVIEHIDKLLSENENKE